MSGENLYPRSIFNIFARNLLIHSSIPFITFSVVESALCAAMQWKILGIERILQPSAACHLVWCFRDVLFCRSGSTRGACATGTHTGRHWKWWNCTLIHIICAYMRLSHGCRLVQDLMRCKIYIRSPTLLSSHNLEWPGNYIRRNNYETAMVALLHAFFSWKRD